MFKMEVLDRQEGVEKKKPPSTRRTAADGGKGHLVGPTRKEALPRVTLGKTYIFLNRKNHHLASAGMLKGVLKGGVRNPNTLLAQGHFKVEYS